MRKFKRGSSLDDYIVGKATIDSVVGENAGGFDVIASRGDQSIDLIASEQFAVLVDSLRKNYDYVILAGDAFGDYSAFSVVATMADRMLGYVEAGELRENFTEFDNELKHFRCRVDISFKNSYESTDCK